MSYNVENLFDATDDGVYQEDLAFLPLSLKRKWKTDPCKGINGYFGRMCRDLDWTQIKYEERLERLSNVMLSYKDEGADIIFLHEIENETVMLDLWKGYLKAYGYKKPFHFESPSHRGIDVGVISRLPLAENPIAHEVDLKDMGSSTRDIIEVTYRIKKGKRLKVAGNHWPSQASGTEARLRASEIVRDIAYEAIDQDMSFVAVGDFNTLLKEVPNPISDYLADNDLYDLEYPLVDLQNYLQGFSTFPYDGSHFYQGHWDPLDRILVSKDILRESGDFKLVNDSFDVFYLDDMITDIDPDTGKRMPYEFPFRYGFFTEKGYSDHLPLVVEFAY